MYYCTYFNSIYLCHCKFLFSAENIFSFLQSFNVRINSMSELFEVSFFLSFSSFFDSLTSFHSKTRNIFLPFTTSFPVIHTFTIKIWQHDLAVSSLAAAWRHCSMVAILRSPLTAALILQAGNAMLR